MPQPNRVFRTDAATRAATIIVMGVAGSGKTTVGRALADRLGWRFCDADDLHSAENIRRIRRNLPLRDRDREPWLQRVRATIEQAQTDGAGLVVACSALKERYRQILSSGIPGVRFVYLAADAELLRDRLRRRQGHFAGPALLDSQLADLEPPDHALHVDASLPVDAIVDMVHSSL